MPRSPAHKKRKPSLTGEPYGGSLRGEIAYRAARLIADDGITDIASAKQKAARQMGVAGNSCLPDNLEIDAALRAQQSIFQSNCQPQECRSLLENAIVVMRKFDGYSPRLVGAVLNGTANRFSPIELEIVADDAKQLEMFLTNEGVRFKTHISHRKKPQPGEAQCDNLVYELSFREIPIRITLFPRHADRSAHHSRQSLKYARANLADVESLLDN